MSLPTFTFYAFAAILVFAALRVITTRNPVHAALWLVLSFFSAAGVWLLLQAEFLAIALVLVYVGAVMVLFLFVVTMLTPEGGGISGPDRLRWQWAAGLGLGVILAAGLSIALLNGSIAAGAKAAGMDGLAQAVSRFGNTEAFGQALFHGFSFPFEVTGVLLVIAVLGAVVLSRRFVRAPGEPGQPIQPAQPGQQSE
jgi:NADH-quinone oxidoreductase subunit J